MHALDNPTIMAVRHRCHEQKEWELKRYADHLDARDFSRMRAGLVWFLKAMDLTARVLPKDWHVELIAQDPSIPWDRKEALIKEVGFFESPP